MSKALNRRLDRLGDAEGFTVIIAPPGTDPRQINRDAYGSDPRVIVLPDGAQRL